MALGRLWPLLAHHARLGPCSVRFSSTDAAALCTKASKSKFRWGTVATVAAVGSTAYGLGSIYPPQLLAFAFPIPAPSPPDAGSPEGIAKTADIEAQLQTLPEVQKHRANHDGWYETRPHLRFPEERRVNSFTAGALRGPGKLAVAPILFAAHDESETIGFLHVGRGLCGHDGIIHGGLLATILDESLARTAVLNLPNKIGVTANLNLNYRAPTKADQFLRIESKLVETKGRKAVVKGSITDLDGNVLVDATAVFIEPRYSALLKSSWVTSALGRSPKAGQEVLESQQAAV